MVRKKEMRESEGKKLSNGSGTVNNATSGGFTHNKISSPCSAMHLLDGIGQGIIEY